MKIGIVALGFIPGGTGGTETYFRSLIEGLQKYDKRNDYSLIVKSEYRLEAAQLVSQSGWKVIGLSEVPPLAYRVARKVGFRRFGSNSQRLAQMIDAMDFDLVHFPFQVIYPSEVSTPSVVTFMDMQEKHFPEFFSREELAFRKQAFTETIKNANRIIAISEATKLDVVKYYGRSNGEKCIVIPLTFQSLSKVSKKVSLARQYTPYFYYPAASWPHKNHERLLRAFARVSTHHPEYKLVLTGMQRQQQSKIEALIRKLRLDDKVVDLGYVDYADVPGIYASAFGLVFPSLFEGFGIPVLEALSRGIPATISDSSSLPEVGGEAAIYFDPKNIADIASAMEKLIQDKRLYKRLQKLGPIQAAKFSQHHMIDHTLDVYNEVYAQKTTKQPPLVYLVTPVFNRKKHTLKYLASLKQQTYKNFRAVIIDDASSDGTAAAVHRQYPDAIVLEGDGNLWWSGGTNVGVEKALEDQADYVLTINDDLEVRPDYIESLVKQAERHPQSLIGSIVLDKHDPEKVWYFGADFDQATGVMQHVSGVRKDYTKSVESAWLTGMGVLIPVEVFSKVGLFNQKDFPQYFGDVEFSLRARQAGYGLWISPTSEVISDVESNWVTKSLDKPRLRFWWQLFFSIRSPYQLTSRVKFYHKYWPGNYRSALFKLYFGNLRGLYRAWTVRWMRSKPWLQWIFVVTGKG